MSTVRSFIRSHLLAVAIFVVAIGTAATFGIRFASDARYFKDPAHREQALEGWMTPRYVGMSWGLPKHVIGDIMDLDPDSPRDGRPPTLDQVAATLGITLAELQVRVEDGKARHEAEREDRKNDRDDQGRDRDEPDEGDDDREDRP